MAWPDDELPEIEVVGGAREARTEVEIESGPPQRSRSPWIIALMVAAVIVSAVGLSSRGDGTESEEEAEPTTTSSTTEARSTTSTSPPTSTTSTPPEGEYLIGSPAPVLGERVNISLLLLGDSATPRQVNLDTGWVVELSELRRAEEWWQSVPVVDGLVFQSSGSPKHLALPAVEPGDAPERPQVDLSIEGLDQFTAYSGLVPSG